MKSLPDFLARIKPWYQHHPYAIAAGVVICVISVVTICWPSSTLSGITPEEQARRDSLALHVAFMPVADCLPFYYAERTGIYDELGLDLRILTLQAQLDTDTALLRGHAELVYSDLIRAIMLQQAGTEGLRAVASTDAELTLVTAHKGRVSRLTQLRERMVAVARHSITDYWSDRLMDTAHMAQTDIFRPQINDVRVRTDMLCNGTMDAAFLCEPFLSEALLRGNRKNFETHGLQPRLGAFLVPTRVLNDTNRKEQLQLLFKGYELAVQQLNQGRRDSIPSLLRSLCSTPDSLIDSVSMRLPHFTPLTAPRQADAEAALQWLMSRSKAPKDYSLDTLISPIFFSAK